MLGIEVEKEKTHDAAYDIQITKKLYDKRIAPHIEFYKGTDVPNYPATYP